MVGGTGVAQNHAVTNNVLRLKTLMASMHAKHMDCSLQSHACSFTLRALIGDEVSDLTVTAMGNQAEQLIGCTLETLRRKRFYVSEHVIPPEITSLIGQIHVFNLRGNVFGDWTVIGVGPSIKNDDIASAVNEAAIGVGPSMENYNITSPVTEAGINSPTELAELELHIPEKSCIQPKRTHAAIQQP